VELNDSDSNQVQNILTAFQYVNLSEKREKSYVLLLYLAEKFNCQKQVSKILSKDLVDKSVQGDLFQYCFLDLMKRKSMKKTELFSSCSNYQQILNFKISVILFVILLSHSENSDFASNIINQLIGSNSFLEIRLFALEGLGENTSINLRF
jgi:hypothetical protein